MTMVKSLQELLRKKSMAKGLYAEVWDCFFKTLGSQDFFSKAVTLNLYSIYPSFMGNWMEIVDEETGEIISEEELNNKKISPEERAERFTRVYNPSKYEQEIKKLKDICFELEKEGFKTFVGFDRDYKQSFAYPPYITLSW